MAVHLQHSFFQLNNFTNYIVYDSPLSTLQYAIPTNICKGAVLEGLALKGVYAFKFNQRRTHQFDMLCSFIAIILCINLSVAIFWRLTCGARCYRDITEIK